MKNSVLSGRFLLNDALWKAIDPLIRAVKGPPKRRPTELSERLFVEAIPYQARTGNPWRDMPKEFGCWNSAYKRFRRWERWGLWKRIWKQFQRLDDKPLRSLFIDSTIMRAHQHASGALKKRGGQQKQAMGKSRGGLTTKLHAACSDDRTVVSLALSPGQSHDATAFPSVWEGVPKTRWLGAAVMDKAYDSDNIRRFLEHQGIEAVIPPRAVERDYFLTTIWMSTTAQAQSYIIDIYPSQDNPNQTLWIFWHVGRQQAHYGSTIRGIGGTNYKVRDSWKYAGDDGALYFANKPTNEVFSLSPLFSSTNHPKDIDSITKRLHGSHGFGPFTTNTIYFQDRVTNVPTIFAGNASKTIGGIFMNDADGDEIGIRGTSGANLSYTNGQSFRWFGTGILDKPISDFDLTYPVQSWGSDTQNSPYFAANENRSVRIRIHSSVIPEPEEYALVFGLFALAFVIVRRQFKRNRQL